MKKIALILLYMTLTLSASEINIAVAANVSYAIEALKEAFEKEHPEIKVGVTLGSSGKLTAQIMHGAPYGLFMSANMDYPEALEQKKMTLTKPQVYAKGALAYFSLQKRDFTDPLALLRSEKITRIAIANPKTAPYGKATKEALQKAKVYTLLKPKFIYGESIAQTVSYAVTAADIGIIAKSALFAKQMQHFKKGIHWSALDPTLYSAIDQGIVLLKYAQDREDYRAFYNFILSAEAQVIFQKYGYITS